ncbi:Phosphoribosylglycinamide formyltransferase [hydrothermal vent metagenome]|uniref:phosphoribosylglycinamide formyltransferase 1 n=1 Tax=hydrothermal vent metagenome TaxID=652676 RepID=A0A3B0TLD2_9ZZZZ
MSVMAAPKEKTEEKKRVAILISGRGSNMSALIRAAKQPGFPAEIAGIISNKASAAGLEIAQNENLPTAIHQLKNFAGKDACDAAITKTLLEWQVDIVCLAGFMRILSARFTRHWQGKLINIHPSLLPKFKGLDTHQRALEAGESKHGCSVHFVVPELDAGPVIARSVIDVLPDDTPDTLAARILVEEHKTYPKALEQLALGHVRLEAGKAIWSQNPAPASAP